MPFRNIVLFGAGGTNIGHHILHALLDDGNFNITVLARASSKTMYSPRVSVVKVANEFDHNELVNALQGQDVVISTVGNQVQMEQYKVIDAAIDAGVQRLIPSEWGLDNADVKNQQLCTVFETKRETEMYLRSRQSSIFSWTSVATGIWLDWALNNAFISIDTVAHSANYWSDGSHTPSCTTLHYCAQATLQILKHPDETANKRVFLSAFEASQQGIVAELEKQQQVKYVASRVDGDKIVREAQAKWTNDGDQSAAYILVSAGVLLPEHEANFVTAGKQPILENMVPLPRLTLEDVVKEWVDKDAQ